MDGDLQLSGSRIDWKPFVRYARCPFTSTSRKGYRRFERRARSPRCSPELLCDEVRRHAVTRVLANDPSAARDLSFEGTPDVPDEPEVDGTRKLTRKRPGRLKIGE